MQAPTSLQSAINLLAQQYGPNTKEYHQQVSAFLQAHAVAINPHLPPPVLAPPSAPVPVPVPAPQSQTPTPVSSRGRLLRPTKPFTTTPSTPRPRHQTPPGAGSASSSSLVQQQQQQQQSSHLNPYQPPRIPTRFQLGGSSDEVVPPLSSICPPPPGSGADTTSRFQAMFTTLPARMRLGTSGLMQPSLFGGGGDKDSLGGASGAGGAGLGAPTGGEREGSKRARTVNYAEMAGEDFGDDDDFGGGGGGRRGLPKRVVALASGSVGNDKPHATDKTVWGDGKTYLGTLPPGNLVVVQQAKGTRHVVCSEEQIESQANQASVLVPINIDLDVDNFKIRDSFLWNVNEKLITPTSFARIFIDDLDLPSHLVSEVTRQIEEQIEEQTGIAEVDVRSEEEEKGDEEKDLRVILNLDVQIGPLHLLDKIEWDLSSPLTVETFTSSLTRDLSLSSSAVPLISHAIHSELFKHKKLCIEMGLLGPVEGRRRGARQLEGVWREWPESLSFGPSLKVLSLDEMDRVEADRERAVRRAKRDRLAGSARNARRR
ncbi:SNF5-domain-containing protein [Meredithblackwellia eburnea MCA 4105]